MSNPVVGNFSPDPSVAVNADSPLGFDVTDTTALRVVVVMVKLVLDETGVGKWEVAYDGAAFGPNYSTLSTVASITNGLRFRLRRDNGWPSTPPTVDVVVVNTAGNVPV